MKRKLLFVTMASAMMLGVFSCEKHKEKNDAENRNTKPALEEMEFTMSINEPDEHFYDAIIDYNNGENFICSNDIEGGIQFMKMIKDNADEVNKARLETEIKNLSTLALKVKENKVESDTELKFAFEQAHKALAGNAVTITETLIDEGYPEDAQKSSHAVTYYLHQAERSASNDMKAMYHETIKTARTISTKSAEEFKGAKKEVKEKLHEIKAKLN